MPPDSAAASGNSQLVQSLNSKIGIYTKASPPALVNALSLATLFSYTAQPLFDPRVIYDDQWDRWVISAEAFPESANVQMQCIAVSLTRDANGSYYVSCFDVNPTTSADYFWDFPNLGMTQDAIIITANVFDPNFVGSSTFAIAKSCSTTGSASRCCGSTASVTR
jgi:hypothetical protein